MSLGSCEFRARRGSVAPAIEAGRVRLRGEVEWIAHSAVPGEIAALLETLGPLAERLDEGTAILRFGNAVGRFRVRDLGQLEVYCGKWDESAFDGMLHDLSAIALALPFAATDWQGLPYERVQAEDDPILLHRFLYIRHIVLGAAGGLNLPRTLESIVRDPHRRFTAEREHVGLAEARRLDTRTIEFILSGRERMLRASAEGVDTALLAGLNGWLPIEVDSPRVTHSVDTAENAFVKMFLRLVMDTLAAVERRSTQKAAQSPSFWRRIADDCVQVRRALLPATSHDMWTHVSALRHVPLGSSVLQRRHGYRDVLRHYLELRAASHFPLDATDAERLLGIKDVARLYEIWAFYQVIDAMTRILQLAPERVDSLVTSTAQVSLRQGMRVSWAGGYRLHYNPSFTRRAMPPRRSTSMRLRPDIVLQRLRGQKSDLHVLDAKLRIDAGDADGAARGFKRDDIVKMHAYRDALPSVCSACILYPGSRTVFFPSAKSGAVLHGVGAIPLAPGEGQLELEKHLVRILG